MQCASSIAISASLGAIDCSTSANRGLRNRSGATYTSVYMPARMPSRIWFFSSAPEAEVRATAGTPRALSTST